MRLWSIHPKYLDSKGLVALWRESLLAKSVLENKTQGYKNHPQLIRFKALSNPVMGINQYIEEIFFESQRRKFNFNNDKFLKTKIKVNVKVTSGQLEYEFNHLIKKLKIRDLKKYTTILKDQNNIVPHPMFKVVHGSTEHWEKT